jgi:hypothetical protein
MSARDAQNWPTRDWFVNVEDLRLGWYSLGPYTLHEANTIAKKKLDEKKFVSVEVETQGR